MLDDLFKRQDVLHLIDVLKKSNMFHLRNQLTYSYHDISMSYELGLYLFYDALIKFYIVVQDESLLPDFLEQIQKLYRKLDTVEDIQMGIHKLICNELMTYFHMSDCSSIENRNKIIYVVYDRYIRNGYFFHGFSSCYYQTIRDNGFVPEEYENYYERFKRVNTIFKKYNLPNVISKDFLDKKVYFTDDIVMGCYYSMCSPMFFYQFLLNHKLLGKRVQEDDYWYDRYEVFENALKRLMSNHLFNEKDRKFILDLFQDEWRLLHRRKRKICLLLIDRQAIPSAPVLLEEYVSSSGNVYDIVDRILSSKYNQLSYGEVILPKNIKLLTLEHFYEKRIVYHFDENVKDIQKPKEIINQDYLNAYGNVSLLLIIGSLFISLGVIISILSMLRG